MTNELQVFNFGLSEIRVVTVNGEIWFVAKDVCDVLEIGDTSSALRRLDEDEKGTDSIPTLGGNQVMACVNESGLYSLVLGSRKPEAKAFKRWITHEVLPTIRKTGGYVNNDDLFINTYIPQADEQTKLLFKTTLKTMKMQSEKIAALQPKADKFDNFLNSDGYMTMNDVAKILVDAVKGIGRNLLFEYLRYKGVLMSDNTPYQRYMTQGRFKVVEKPSNGNYTNKVTLCTVKGFDFIADIVAEGYENWKAGKRGKGSALVGAV